MGSKLIGPGVECMESPTEGLILVLRNMTVSLLEMGIPVLRLGVVVEVPVTLVLGENFLPVPTTVRSVVRTALLKDPPDDVPYSIHDCQLSALFRLRTILGWLLHPKFLAWLLDGSLALAVDGAPVGIIHLADRSYLFHVDDRIM